MIRATLERASVRGRTSPFVAQLDQLRVVDRCGCGCDSMDFLLHDPDHPAKPVADGIGTTPSGGMVGVLVWGRDDEVTALEVYDLGAGQEDLRLPDPASIQPFDGGAS